MTVERNDASSLSRKLLVEILEYFSQSPIAETVTSLQLKQLADLLTRGGSLASGSCVLETGEDFRSLQYSNATRAAGRTYTFYVGVDISRSAKYPT